MSLVRLIIKGISYSQTQNGAYALILSELEGQRKLPIVIGAFEAQSIAIALEKEIKPPKQHHFASLSRLLVLLIIKLLFKKLYSLVINSGK